MGRTTPCSISWRSAPYTVVGSRRVASASARAVRGAAGVAFSRRTFTIAAWLGPMRLRARTDRIGADEGGRTRERRLLESGDLRGPARRARPFPTVTAEAESTRPVFLKWLA